MSKQIDERIVEMRFENDKFEKNVATTMSTLDKLKEKLAFKNAKDGFDDIQKSANKVSFEHLVESVDKLSDTISHRTGIMGGVFEALGNRIVGIFDGAFSKVQNMINQVTMEPIMSGFSEYELKVNSVQTIAANTGVLMRDVMNEMNNSGEALIDSSEALEMAWDVWYGKYGTGTERVEALGDNYAQVQGLVNKIASGEIKMGQTIEDVNRALGEQEYTMEDIEHVLDELNTYADKTIYNYAQMTDAIGKFTVAGVDLYDATSAVQGIANLGAFVGAGEADTSRIMRELAQGLSTGIINLQDWKSLENSAGFAGTVFQDHLVDMADHLYETNDAYREYIQSMHGDVGTIKDLVDSYGKFRNSLTEGAWLNDTVLINTLHEFAGDWGDDMYEALGYTEQETKDLQALGNVAFDAATKSKTFTQMWDAVTEAAQSSWTTTWEYIFGHFYDARNLWTIIGDTLSDIIESNNEARNEVLRVWSETGGRDEFFSGVGHLFMFFKNIADSLKDVWVTLFPPMSGEKLTEFSIKFNQFAESLENMKGFYAIAKSLGTVLFTLLKAGTVVLGSFFKLLDVTFGGNMDGRVIDNLEDMALYLEHLVTSFVDLDNLGDKATAFFSNFLNVLKAIPIVLLSVAVGIDELSKEFLGFSIIDGIKMIGAEIPTLATKIKAGFGLIKPFLTSIKEFFTTVKDSGEVQSAGNAVTDILDKLKIDREKGRTITTIAAGLAQLWLVFHSIKAVKSTGKLSSILTTLPEGISEAFESIKEAGENVSNLAKSGIIITIAKSLLILAVAMGIMALIPSDKLKEVSATLVIVMGGLMLLMKVMGGLFDKLPNNTIIKGAGAMALLAVSIGILVGSIALLTILDYEAAVNSLLVIGVLMVMIGVLIDKFNHARFRSNVPKVAAAIFIIVQAISSMAMLIAVLSIVAKFNSGGMWNAFGLVTALFAEIVGLYTLIVKVPFTASAKKIAGLAGAIALIIGALVAISAVIAVMSIIARFNSGAMWNAFGLVTAILVILATLAAGLVLLTKIPNINPVGTLAMAGSMVIIIHSLIGVITALALVSAIQNDDIWKPMFTLTGVIGLMILLIAALGTLRPKRAKSILAAAVAVNLISFAILTMAEGLLVLSKLNFDNKKVLIVVGGTIAALGVLVGLMAVFSRLSGAGNTITRTTNIMFGNTSPIHKFLTGLAALLLSISISIWLIVDAINKIMSAADRFNGDDNMTNKLTEMFKGIAQAFANSWSYIAEAVDNAGIGDDLDRWFKSFLDHLLDAIAYLLSEVVALIGVVATSIVDAIINVLNALAGTDLTTYGEVLDGDDSPIYSLFERFVEDSENAPINKLINAIVAFVALVIYGVGDAIKNNATPIVAAVAHVLESLGYLLLTMAAAIYMIFMPDFDMNMLAEYINDIHENWAELWLSGFDEYIKPAITNFGKKLAAILWTGLFAPIYMVVEGVAWVYDKYVDLINGIVGYDYMSYMDTSGIEEFYGMIIEDTGLVEEQANKATEAVNTSTESMQEFTNTLDYLAGKNVESTVTLNPTFATNTDKLNQDLFTAGDNAGKESVKGFNKAWDIHSPSVVGEQSGNDIGAGVVNGISGYFNSPEAQEKLSGIKDSLSKVDWSGLYDSDTSQFNLDPSQVFNLNTDSMGDDLMQSGFGDTFSGMSLNMGNVSTDLADVNNSTQEISDALANEGGKFYDDTDVVNELNGLRTDISNFSRAMTQIKMYLDTNKLVGELVGPLDGALAQRASRAQRGN